MLKTVTPRLTRSTDSSDYETDGHSGVITVVLRCGESVVKLIIRSGVAISHALCLPCHVDLTDTISCSNHCILTLYCLNRSFDCHQPTADDDRHRHWQLASRAANVPLLAQKPR